jgi:hypothetical protein
VVKIAPETAIKFWVYENMKRMLASSGDTSQLNALERFVSGMWKEGRAGRKGRGRQGGAEGRRGERRGRQGGDDRREARMERNVVEGWRGRGDREQEGAWRGRGNVVIGGERKEETGKEWFTVFFFHPTTHVN